MRVGSWLALGGVFLASLPSVAVPQIEQPIKYPKVYNWDFETVSENGRELWSDEAVPIYVDERPSQQNWRQVFGSAASTSQPDRFPRGTLAHFVRIPDAISGDRALRLQTRGDNVLVSLANSERRQIFGEAEVTFRGWVRTVGLSSGRLRIILRFFKSGLEIPDSRVVSAPIGGDGGPGDRPWKRYLLVQDRAPIDAEEFDIQILLEGSYEDHLATVWLDRLQVELMPGCRLAWPGRSNLLIQPGEPVELKVECFGLNRGTYRVRVSMRRTWPKTGGETRRLTFESTRYVSSQKVPLRLLEDLRSRFFLVEDDLGPGLYAVDVDILWQGKVISSGRNEFAWIGSWSESTPTPTVRLGWILDFDQSQTRRFEDIFHYRSSDFPLQQVLLDLGDWSPVRRSLTQRQPTAEETLARIKSVISSDSRVSWAARIEWGEDVPAEAWRDFFTRALPGLRTWHIRSQRPLTAAEAKVLVDLKRESPILEFGIEPDEKGRIPHWAQFRVVDVDPDRPQPWHQTQQPTPKDWAIIRLPEDLTVSQRVAFFGRAAINLAQRGFRKIFVHTRRDFFHGPENVDDEFIAPDPYLLGWIGAGRFLGRSMYRSEYDWDRRGKFLRFNDYGEIDTLVVYSRDGEEFTWELWTGEALKGSDLLGSAVDVPFDPRTGVSRIPVRPVPKFLFPLPTGRVETALSLRRRTESLRPWPRTQQLTYEIRNHTERAIDVSMELEVLPGWKARGQSGRRVMLPGTGEYKAWHWQVDLPQPPPLLQEYPFTVVATINEDGQEYRYRYEDSILLGSDVVELTVSSQPPDSHTVPFRLLNISPRSLRLQVFSRLVGRSADQGETSRTWNPVFLPQVPPAILEAGDREALEPYARELRFVLPFPLRTLAGEEIWIGFQVGGRGDFNTFNFKVIAGPDEIRLDRGFRATGNP